MRLTDRDCIAGDPDGVPSITRGLDDCTDIIDDDRDRDDKEPEVPFFLGKSGGGSPFKPE